MSEYEGSLIERIEACTQHINELDFAIISAWKAQSPITNQSAIFEVFSAAGILCADAVEASPISDDVRDATLLMEIAAIHLAVTLKTYAMIIV